MDKFLSSCEQCCAECSLPPQASGDERGFSYGTAGFRLDSKYMPFICTRIGIVAALRAFKCDATVGIVLTASHNPWTDNGVKLIDFDGSMLEESWEAISSEIVNAKDVKAAVMKVINCMDQRSKRRITAAQDDDDNHSKVIVGYDTRMNNGQLAEIIGKTCARLNIRFEDLGFLTTPQLHYITRAANAIHFRRCCDPPGEKGYYEKFASAFAKAMFHLPQESNKKLSAVVDAANGIGGPKLAKMLEFLSKNAVEHDIQIVNNGGADIVRAGPDPPPVSTYETLNKRCGSDYVKTNLVVPDGFKGHELRHCVAFDGDADRIIYFSAENKMNLLDGDRIAVLCAMYIRDLLLRIDADYVPTVGVVQTAYSNGNCTSFIRDRLHVPVVITHTGVKHLQREAKRFDIGIYFEANGHGTVGFTEEAIARLRYRSAFETSFKSLQAYNALFKFSQLINQTVGDAITTFLAVELILKYFKMDLKQWSDLYDDLPNKLLKWPSTPGRVPKQDLLVQGPDCVCVKPEELAAQIEALSKGNEQSHVRAFVRQSGTERIVRVYVEADTTEVVDQMAEHIVALLEKHIGYTEC